MHLVVRVDLEPLDLGTKSMTCFDGLRVAHESWQEDGRAASIEDETGYQKTYCFGLMDLRA